MRKIALLLLGVVFFTINYGLCQTATPPQKGMKTRSFYISEAQKIKIGQTTEAEVIAILGNPSHSGGVKSRRSGLVFEENLFFGPVVVTIDRTTGKVSNVITRQSP